MAISPEWTGRPTLVTGAGGFIGSTVVENLVRAGARVRAFVRYNSRNDFGSLELFGGIMLAVGLFTRPVALAIAVEMMVISLDVYWPNGYFAGTRGYEHTLLWALIALAIAARGGGKQSADRLIGKEF